MDAYPKVLLVDDEPFNLDYLEQELEDLDLKIFTASNGQEALDVVARHQPDMIFLDIMMPVMDGFQVLKHLKADPLLDTIPVIIISATSDMPSVVKGIEMGAEDFLPKPFNPVLLHARLNAGLEKKRLRDIEREHLHALERELEIGQKIQAGFLPRFIPQPQGWQISVYFQAAREVAGDFYDIFDVEDGRLALLVGDVTDKGVGSALYMALFRSLLRSTLMLDSFTDNVCLMDDLTPALRLSMAVTLVNNYICTIHESAMFATLFYAVLDTYSGVLTYLNAGHDYPYIIRNERILEKLPSTGPLVGAFDGAGFETGTVNLEAGDTLVLYTDGATDARDPNGEMFGQERWQQLVKTPIPSPNNRLAFLKENILAHIGDAPQYDDISLVTLQRL